MVRPDPQSHARAEMTPAHMIPCLAAARLNRK
jgi:hypothetical protein